MNLLKSAALIGLLLISGIANALTVTVSWVNATTNTDNSLIPATGPGSLTQTRVEYGTCGPGNVFGVKAGEVVAPAPALSIPVNLVVVQTYCLRAFSMNTYGQESGPSAVALKAVPAPVPNPPSGFSTSPSVALTIIKQVDKFVLLPVGIVPAGTPYISGQTVNGYCVVPRANVQWSGNVRPEVVVTQCT